MTQAGKSLFFAAAVVALSLAAVTPSHASTITFYTNQSAFDSAATTSLLEDFEAFTPKDTPFSSITSHGVVYTGFAGVPFPNVWVASPGYNNFGAGVGTTTTSILTANGDEDILMTFTMTPLAVGFDFYFNGLGPVTLTVTNTAYTSTFTYGADLDSKGYYGIVSTDPILSIRFTSTDGGRLNTGVDNISISSVPEVPEPTTLALLGAGVLGLGRMRKRK
jgi:hypothetical protein